MGLQNTTGVPNRPRPLQQGDRASARDLSALFGAVFGARAEWPLEVKVGRDGLVFRLSSSFSSTWDVFGFRMKPGNLVTIRKRAVRIHQVATIHIVEQDVELNGEICWVYAAISRNTYSPAPLITSAAEPVSDDGILNVVLYSFALVAATGKYTIDTAGMFDVNLGVG